MKKSLFLSLLLAIVSIMATGCSSCQSENKKQENVSETKECVKQDFFTYDYDGVIEAGLLDAEHIISTDREEMYRLADGRDYRWFETDILLVSPLDEEDCSCDVFSVTDVFQAITEKGGGYDTKVFMLTTTSKSHDVQVFPDAFYIENYPLNDEPLSITFQQAYDLAMQANIPKPNSRNCVLRKPVGPNRCNAQYIFGNLRQQIYVDAVTGAVSAENPAFFGYLGKPLGEWP